MKKAGSSTNKAQLVMMQSLMDNIFGGTVPTLRKIIGEEHFLFVKPSSNVREATHMMSEARKGILIMEDDELIGILTPKDVLSRVLAKGKSPDLTAVSSVMTPNPDCVNPDITLLDALKEMHDHKFLHLPIREDDGRVLGLVDVMELMSSSAGGGKGWRDFFKDAFDADREDVETASQYSIQSSSVKAPRLKKYSDDSQSTIEPICQEFVFKVVDTKGSTHRIKCTYDSFSALQNAVITELGINHFKLTYIDEDQDIVTLSTDSSLSEAVESARNANKSALKLSLTIINESTPSKSNENIVNYLLTPFKKYDPNNSRISEKEYRRRKLLVSSGLAVTATAGILTGLIIYLRKK
jgi:CBS domain-containing protein